LSSPGKISAIDMRFVTSRTASQRLEVVSSGETTRKVVGLAFITSRIITPCTRVASASVAPGALTVTA
jgi:hypothetical protein